MARTPVATDALAATLANFKQLNAWGGGSCTISNSQLVGAGSGSLASIAAIVWDAAGTFSPDQYSEVELQNLTQASLGYWHAAIARCSGVINSSGAQLTYYAAVAVPSNASGVSREIRLVKIVNGVATTLATSTVVLTNGDRLGIECQGTTLRWLKNGASVVEATDASIATGKPGVVLAALGANMRNFTGGNVTAAVLSLGTPSAQSGTVGSAISWAGSTLAALVTDGTAPYSYSVASGTLPAGLALNSSTGVISGTPTTAGSAAVVFRVTDSAGSPATADSGSVIFTTAAAAVSTATITVPGLAAWTGTVQAALTVPNVVVVRRSDRVQVLALANQAASASGDLVINSAALSAGVGYMVLGFTADGASSFRCPVTAA